MKPKRTTISLPTLVHERAKEMMRKEGYLDFSGYVAELLRAEWRRTHGDAPIPELNEAPEPYGKKGKAKKKAG